MSAEYEFWLTDDAGRRLFLLKDFGFASYSRTSRGYGTLLFGLPLDAYLSNITTIFQPDWRIDVWRSPEYGMAKRRESSYFLRKFRIYDRQIDSMRMIEFFGHSPIDILRRWHVSETTVSEYEKSDYIDDMMKEIVRDVFITGAHVVPAGEFSVDGDVSLGPGIAQAFRGKNVLDALTELKNTSLDLNFINSTNRKIYFDVVEGPGLTNGFGYIFRTYADLRGIDRTNGVVFSPENGNLDAPEYIENYIDQITRIKIGATEVSNSDTYLSRWSDIAEYRSSDLIGYSGAATSQAHQVLADKAKQVSLSAYFKSTPGSPNQPRSLYGLDWDMGDLLPVQYAGINMNAEVEIVWVSVNESGAETIVGANKVGT